MPQIPENTQFPLPNFSHSEEVDELLGKPPAWLLRSGIGVIFTVLLSFFIASWFIKYPEVVSSQVVFTTLNPPVSLVARSNGKIQELFVKANDSVKAYEVIAIIENTTNYKALTTLESKLGKEDFSNEKLNIDFSLLGELQTPYENYCKALKDYQLFKELDYNNLKIKALEQQIVFQKQLGNNLGEQSGLQKEDLQLYKRQFEADSLLRKQGAVALREVEQAKSSLIQRKNIIVQAKAAQINSALRITELQQQIIDLQLKEQELITQYQQQMQRTKAELQSQINAWKQKYIISSPITGRVSFNQFWNINQEVKAGEEVFAINPSSKENELLYCKTVVESRHAAKVQIGQALIIKLAAYPFERFGILRATVAEISALPKEDKFAVVLKLSNGLQTNYHKTLIFKPQMQGTAEIITEDLRLLERLFYQYRGTLTK